MPVRKPEQFEVVVRQWIKVGHRTIPDEVDRVYTVWARTPHQARKAVLGSGVRGKIVKVAKVFTP